MTHWKQFQATMLNVIKELHEVSDKHNETRPKVLCIAFESALNAPATGEFIFPADIQKNLSAGIKEISQSEESHPEVQEKVALLQFWLEYYSQRISAPDQIEEEALAVMERVLAVYSVKKRAVRTSLIDAIFDEANNHIVYVSVLN